MRVDCYPEAPSEWPRKTVGELAEIDPPYRLEVGKAYPFVEMASVREGFGGIERFEQRIWDRSGLCRFKENDLMLGKITPCAENGKAALVSNLPDTFGIGSTEFFVLSPNDSIVPEFLFAAVTAGPFHRRLVSRMEGSTGRLRITRDTLKKWLALPLPPLDEQRRIAAALKLADDAIQKARAELDATRELKRSLMKSVFSEGLERYRTGWQETKLGRLPASWQVKRVKDVLVGKPLNGYSPQSNPEPPGTKTLNVSCIRNGECAIEKATYVDIENAVVASLQVRRGDFFVLRGNGNRDFIGIGGVVRDDITEPMIYSDLLFRLQFKESEVVPLFLPYMWQTQAFLHRLQAKAKSGSGLWKIGKRDIEKELLALPGRDEQREIVNLIDSSIDACNAAAKKVEALTEVKRSLLQNLLTGKIRIPEGAIHV